MKKVDEHCGRGSAYFLGLTSEEAGLQPGLPPVWDQTAKRLPNGEKVEESGGEIAVIDRDGNKIDPAGYVNIIPMIKDTEGGSFADAGTMDISTWADGGHVTVTFAAPKSKRRAVAGVTRSATRRAATRPRSPSSSVARASCRPAQQSDKVMLASPDFGEATQQDLGKSDDSKSEARTAAGGDALRGRARQAQES